MHVVGVGGMVRGGREKEKWEERGKVRMLITEQIGLWYGEMQLSGIVVRECNCHRAVELRIMVWECNCHWAVELNMVWECDYHRSSGIKYYGMGM